MKSSRIILLSMCALAFHATVVSVRPRVPGTIDRTDRPCQYQCLERSDHTHSHDENRAKQRRNAGSAEELTSAFAFLQKGRYCFSSSTKASTMACSAHPGLRRLFAAMQRAE
jgi:hypothetical protein